MPGMRHSSVQNSILGICVFALLICIPPAVRAASVVVVDPANGDDIFFGPNLKTFARLCEQDGSTQYDVQIVSNLPATMPALCNMAAITTISCQSEPCILDFGDIGSFVAGPVSGKPGIQISSVTFRTSLNYRSEPLFTVSGGITMTLLGLPEFSTRRPLVHASSSAYVSIFQCVGIKMDNSDPTPTAGIVLQSASISITRSVFKSSTRYVEPFVRMTGASSGTGFNEVTWKDNVFYARSAGQVMILEQTGGSFTMSSQSNISSNSVFANPSSAHPSMFSFRSSSVQISDSTFSSNSFVADGFASLGSVIVMEDTSYLNSRNKFSLTSSPGCNYIHASNSIGTFRDTEFHTATIVGVPASDVAMGSKYPPYERPLLASAVCLTRNLSNLMADFASVFSAVVPDSTTRNTHELRNCSFHNNIISTTSLARRRRILPDADHLYQLYASDIWGSNVRLLLNDTTHAVSTIHDTASIRVDACNVTVDRAIPGLVSLPGWIDFGSATYVTSSISSLRMDTVAIYGAAPFRTSSYEGPGPVGHFMALPMNELPYLRSIITGGTWNKLTLMVENAHPLVIGSSFPEYKNYANQRPLAPFHDSLIFSDCEVDLSMGSRVTYTRKTGPWIINAADPTRAALAMEGSFSAPLFGTAPIKAKVSIFSTAQLDVVDLSLEGPVALNTAATLNFRPSLYGGVFHGLNITGELTCSSVTQMPLLASSSQTETLLDPMYQALPQLTTAAGNGLIPVMRADSVSNCQFSAHGFPFPYGVMQANGFNEATDMGSFYFDNMFVTVSFHPSGVSGLLFDFPVAMSGKIPVNCVGFLTFPSNKHCRWLTDRRMFVTSTVLDGSFTPSLALNAAYTSLQTGSGVLPNYLPHLKPTAFIDTVFTPVGAPTFLLDASISTHGATLPSLSQFITVEWSVIPSTTDLEQFLNDHQGEWRLEVPTSLLQGTHTFHAELTNLMLTRPVVTSNITVSSSLDSDLSAYCTHPSIRIDSASNVNLYEQTTPIFVLLFDPICESYPLVVTPSKKRYSSSYSVSEIQWEITSPTGGYAITFGNAKPYFQFPAANRPSVHFGDEIRLKAIAKYEDGTQKTAEIKLTFKGVEPVVYSNVPLEVDTQPTPSTIELFPTILPDFDIQATTTEIPKVTCPVPSVSMMHGYPYSEPSPVANWNMLCRSNNQSVVYDMPSAYRANPSSAWHSQDHTFSQLFKVQYSDISTYETPLFAKMKPANKPNKAKFVIDFARFSWKQKPYEYVHGYGITLTAKLVNNSLCIGCIYKWESPQMPYLPDESRSVLHIQVSDFSEASMYVTVTVSYPTVSNGWETSQAQISFKVGQTPFGGTISVDTTSSPPLVSYDLKAWSSNYNNLRYLFTMRDCTGIKLINYLTMNPHFVDQELPRSTCSSFVIETYAIDSIGSTSLVSSSLYEMNPIQPTNWDLNSISGFVAGLARSTQMGIIREIVYHVNEMETLLDIAGSNLWLSQRASMLPLIETAIGSLYGMPYAEILVAGSFKNRALLAMMDSHVLAGHLLKIALNVPDYSRDQLSIQRAVSAVQLIGAVYSSYFGSDLPASTRSIRTQNWNTQVAGSQTLWSDLHKVLTSGVSNTLLGLHMGSLGTFVIFVDTQSILANATHVPLQPMNGVTLSLSSSLFRRQPGPFVDPLWPVSLIVLADSHELLPPSASPYRKVARIEVSFGPQSGQTRSASGHVNASFEVPAIAIPNYGDLKCVSATATANYWQANCEKSLDSSNPNFPKVSCKCPISGVGSAHVTVALVDPSAVLCNTPPPSGGAYSCVDGLWVSEGSIEAPIVSIPSGGDVSVIGNLTVDTLVFGGLDGSLNITGCAKIGTSIEIKLSLEEFEALLASEELKKLLLTASGCDITDLKDVPISLTIDAPGRCEKVSVSSETSSTTLSGVFKVDTAGCKKKSTWWIVLVSVLGGVIVLAVIFALLATLTPLKHVIRPHAKRAEEANTYYMEDVNKS